MIHVEILSRGTKQTAKFYRSMAVGQKRMMFKSAKDIAEYGAQLAKQRAPYASGDTMESIKARSVSSSTKSARWRIYMGTPVYNLPRGRTYPFMQERGYAAHWVYRSQIKPELQDRYPYRFYAKKFTPYLYPAILQLKKKSKEFINKRIKELVKKAARQSGAKIGA